MATGDVWERNLKLSRVAAAVDIAAAAAAAAVADATECERSAENNRKLAEDALAATEANSAECL